MSEEEILNAINKWTRSINQKDFETYYEIEKESFGYGWRGGSFRDKPSDKEGRKQGFMNFLNSMQRYQGRFDPVKIRLFENVALVCGNYIEEITERDGASKCNIVRTSMAWIKSGDVWKLAQYHRDTQFT